MKRFAYLDIEASHTNWTDSEIIEVAFIIQDERGNDLDYFQSLIKPERPIEKEITQLTGITNKMVSKAPEFHEVAQIIAEKLSGCLIVAHKAEFDYELLKKSFTTLNMPFKEKSRCTLKLSQQLIPELKSYSLKSLCEFLQIPQQRNHRAYDDALSLSKLHSYLRLINGELTEEKKFLARHQKIIRKTPKRPGVIIFKYENNQEIVKTDNLGNKLCELLELNSLNRKRITQLKTIKVISATSLIEAGLIHSKLAKPIYPYCIYQVTNKEGKIILRVAKTDLKKKALYYTKTRSEANKLLKNLIGTSKRVKFAYQDSSDLKNEIIKENIALSKQIKKLTRLQTNYLVRSVFKENGRYQYTLIRSNKSYATFESDDIIASSKNLDKAELRFFPMGPREYMSFNHSLNWIKNQKQKTDFLIDVGHI
ncbi:MAG: hypothetical protein CME65_03250 [Halobacteriovoraceae bacterium]|nr:hypothetical protein [Halobacteriovoraceae bacterium]|tara:strand:- start:19073 stop:20341 length:1269 start_codon:yes stop_codon:yes gene_type:complete